MFLVSWKLKRYLKLQNSKWIKFSNWKIVKLDVLLNTWILMPCVLAFFSNSRPGTAFLYMCSLYWLSIYIYIYIDIALCITLCVYILDIALWPLGHIERSTGWAIAAYALCTLTACSLSALAWFWCPTFVRHQR
jgi:hypothetical protein